MSRSYKESLYVLPIYKRLFDILTAGALLLLLLPLLVAIAILIKVESKGKAIYICERIGSNKRPFILYKFRSMYENADNEISKFSNLNQYVTINENNKPIFIKLKNDPRVTKIGKFIRRTSIDELPQLFNILKGDMSIVGNRPLQFFEANMLSGSFEKRFYAPAGLTGLWQISKRGKEVMVETERIKLDNFYAHKQSSRLDLQIIFKTLPAIIQRY